MPRIEDPIAIVNDDIVRGFSPAFEPAADDAGDGFEVSRHLRDIEPISNGEIAAVVWTYRCKQVDWFGTVPPSDQVITIRGTTVVDNRGKEPLYHRYIDWLAVYTALGYTLYQRQMVDEANWEALNFPRVPDAG